MQTADIQDPNSWHGASWSEVQTHHVEDWLFMQPGFEEVGLGFEDLMPGFEPQSTYCLKLPRLGPRSKDLGLGHGSDCMNKTIR